MINYLYQSHLDKRWTEFVFICPVNAAVYVIRTVLIPCLVTSCSVFCFVFFRPCGSQSQDKGNKVERAGRNDDVK